MGGDLKARPRNAGAPAFLVWASKDDKGANLDRIQIVKGWAKNGQTFEKVYNVAWSGARMQDPKTGRIPPVGNTVNVTQATYTNTVGAEKLSVVWRDPDYDPSQRAFYYARVLEIPTPRWSTFDAKKLRFSPRNPVSIQERAFTSPIWYTPSKAEFAKGRSTAMTVAKLNKQGARQLTTAEIKQLLVGKHATIKNLVTGVEYSATYGKDGVRTLSAVPGSSAAPIVALGGRTRNAYQIKDGMLHSFLPDGTRYASRIYRRGTRYYANKNDELDYVNYELTFR